MPRIEPLPWSEIDAESRALIEEGLASGMYSTTKPLEIVAHSPNALKGMHEGYKAVFGKSALGARLQELIRLQSAQLNMCQPCSLSRKDESISESDVACLSDPNSGQYTKRERLALKFVELLALDHHSIDDETYRELGEVFTPEEIVELGWYAGQTIGGHRFIHTLESISDSVPVVKRVQTAVKKTA